MRTHGSCDPPSGQQRRKQKSEDSPEFCYPGGWTPAKVDVMLANGEMTRTELAILKMIDALALGGTERICFASNRYIAGRLGISPRQASRCVSKLVSCGLVVADFGNGELRHLKPSWHYCTVVDHRHGVSRGGRHGVSTTREEEKLNKKKHSVPSGDGTDREASRMLDHGTDLFGKSTGPTIGECSPGDLLMAERLRSAINRVTRRSIPWSKPAWGKQLRLLRKDLEQDQVRIEKVLTWYCKHLGEQWVPQALSAESFRRKFGAIEKAMEREQERNPGEVQVPQEMQGALGRLLSAGWPKGAEAQVPAVLVRSVAALEAFADKLESLDYRTLSSHGLEDLVKSLLREFGDAEYVAEGWLERVRIRLRRWSGWSGSLGSWVWSPALQEVRAKGRELAAREAGDPDLWDVLMEVINP